MIKQVEELENEKRQSIAHLKAQEKKVDHLEHAKRKEEIPPIVESMKQVIFPFLSDLNKRSCFVNYLAFQGSIF